MNLSAFLNPVEAGNKKIIVSKRFVENGKPIAWEIKAITAEQDESIRKTCMIKQAGKPKDFNEMLYLSKLAAACVVYPDLQNAELQDAYGVKNGEDLLKKMLTFAEYNTLTNTIIKANDMDKTAQELLDEAKN